MLCEKVIKPVKEPVIVLFDKWRFQLKKYLSKKDVYLGDIYSGGEMKSKMECHILV